MNNDKVVLTTEEYIVLASGLLSTVTSEKLIEKFGEETAMLAIKNAQKEIVRLKTPLQTSSKLVEKAVEFFTQEKAEDIKPIYPEYI